MLLGGISPERIILVYLLTTSSMLMTTGLAMAISVWTPRSRDAVTRCYVLLLALFVFPPAIWALRGALPAWLDTILLPLVQAGRLANPFWTFMEFERSSPTGVAGLWIAVWPPVATQLTIGLLAIGSAVWGVRRIHLKGAGKATKRDLAWPRLWRPKPGRYPMLWKELFAERAVSQMGVLGRVVVVLIAAGVLIPTGVNFAETLIGVWLHSPGSTQAVQEFHALAVTLGTVVGTGGLLLLAGRGASLVTSEKERDTWVTLISTPLTPGEIVAAKLLGNLYAARVVLMILVVIWGMASLLDVRFLAAAIATLAELTLLGLFVSLVGLLFSLASRTSQRAMAGTLAVTLFLGGGYLFCCVPVMTGPRNECRHDSTATSLLLTSSAISLTAWRRWCSGASQWRCSSRHRSAQSSEVLSTRRQSTPAARCRRVDVSTPGARARPQRGVGRAHVAAGCHDGQECPSYSTHQLSPPAPCRTGRRGKVRKCCRHVDSRHPRQGVGASTCRRRVRAPGRSGA